MFSEGICDDGAAILKDGQLMTIEEILEALNESYAITLERNRIRQFCDKWTYDGRLQTFRDRERFRAEWKRLNAIRDEK